MIGLRGAYLDIKGNVVVAEIYHSLSNIEWLYS